MLEIVAKISFWVCAACLVYIYVGYPILIAFLARWGRHRHTPENDALPKSTVLISAYNERRVIREKIANALALDYPRDRLEIMVVSDCSDDGTDDIVRMFSASGVRLVSQVERRGKSAGLNLAVPLTSGEILVFSDANALYCRDALRHLVRHFSDPSVGYVVGNARYTDADGATPSAESEGLYWKLETWIKQNESAFGSVVGGDGAIYAIRRELFTPLEPTDINDLLNPLQIIARGYRGRYESAAICYEDAGDSFEKEFHRKVRIISRSLNALRREPQVLFPWTQPRHWLALVSHKVLRWLAPAFLLTMFFLSILFWHVWFCRLIAILQIIFYGLAVTALLLGEHRAVSKIFFVPYYFCLMNLAALVGLVKFFRGSLSPIWQTVRHEEILPPDSAVPLAHRDP